MACAATSVGTMFATCAASGTTWVITNNCHQPIGKGACPALTPAMLAATPCVSQAACTTYFMDIHGTGTFPTNTTGLTATTSLLAANMTYEGLVTGGASYEFNIGGEIFAVSADCQQWSSLSSVYTNCCLMLG